MKLAYRLPRRRDAFTLIELLVVMVLILVLAAIGLGYIVFGQDNQHSVSGAQAVTGVLLNAKQRARRDGVPTGVRILFNNGLASQLQLIQQPDIPPKDVFNDGNVATTGTSITRVQFTGADFQGGAATIGQIDESTIQPGDYFRPASNPPTVHRIVAVSAVSGPMGPQTPTIDLASPVTVTSGDTYAIIRGPRRLPSEDTVQLPSGVVIDNTPIPGQPPLSTRTFCQNLPINTINGFAEIVFAPSGAVVGQGTQSDKVYLWLRDPNIKPTAFVTGQPYPGVPLILSVQIRTGLIGVYPVAPWQYNTPINTLLGNDPYAYVSDPRSSGL